MSARVTSVVLTAFVVASPLGPPAGAHEQTDRTSYYNISGSSARELREAMNRLGSVGRDGKRYDALTVWHVRWFYATTVSPDGCALKSLNVVLEIEMTMPWWTNESQGRPQLVERWRSYYAALLEHEMGHRGIADGAAAAIREALGKLPAGRSCDELAASVGRVGGEILERFRQRNRQYDLETGHGRTQGAVFQ